MTTPEPKSVAQLQAELELAKEAENKKNQQQDEVYSIADAFEDSPNPEEDLATSLNLGDELLNAAIAENPPAKEIPIENGKSAPVFIPQFNTQENIDKLNPPVENKEPETVPYVKNAAELAFDSKNELLSNLTFDLTKINIRKDGDPLKNFEELKNLMIRPTFEIIAMQSAYRASMVSLNTDEMIKIRKISGTNYEINRKILSAVYNHIHESTLGKITFEDWCKTTAEEDWETLTYGLYCATYPNESDYNIACPKCGKVHTVKIGKEHLVTVRDNKVFNLVKDIISRKLSPKELLLHSTVNHTTRIVLPTSKIIIDLSTPTLHDMLMSISNTETFKKYEPETFGYLKNISGVYFLNISEYKRSGTVEFLAANTIEEKLQIINNLIPSDRKHLGDAINEKLNEYKIEYRLPNIECTNPDCRNKIDNIVVDMSEVLFKKLAEV
jgi:hypothetical protein